MLSSTLTTTGTVGLRWRDKKWQCDSMKCGVIAPHNNIRLIDLKHHIDYFSKGPKLSQTDRTQKRRSF